MPGCQTTVGCKWRCNHLNVCENADGLRTDSMKPYNKLILWKLWQVFLLSKTLHLHRLTPMTQLILFFLSKNVWNCRISEILLSLASFCHLKTKKITACYNADVGNRTHATCAVSYYVNASRANCYNLIIFAVLAELATS